MTLSATRTDTSRIVPGRFARTLAEVWRLTPEQIAAEHERLAPRPVAPPAPAVEIPTAPRVRIEGTPTGWRVAKEATR